MRYFKRYWDEPVDARSAWGSSWWYFEADGTGVVSRQVVAFDRGPTLRYHEHHLNDEFGMLTDQPLVLSEFVRFEVPRAEFEQVWNGGELP